MSRADARMPSARRRPIPGMISAPAAASPRPPETPSDRVGEPAPGADELAPVASSGRPSGDSPAPDDGSAVNAPEVAATTPRRRPVASSTSSAASAGRRPSRDYASTRLVNFRIPVDLHDRYKRLVREVERTHPRLRHPSLTELLIGLLEEGPDTADEVAAVIRRKRASEHGSEEDA
jgi:hypothetical protein